MTIIYEGTKPNSYIVRESNNVRFYFDTKTVVIDDKDAITYINDLEVGDLIKGVVQLKLANGVKDKSTFSSDKISWIKALDNEVISVLKIGYSAAVQYLSTGDLDLASEVSDQTFKAMRDLADGWVKPMHTTTYRPLLDKLFSTKSAGPTGFDAIFGEGKTDLIKYADTVIDEEFARKLMIYFNAHEIRPNMSLPSNIIS